MSAAEVFAVATPSWKTKGLRSAKDFEGSDAALFVLLLVLRRTTPDGRRVVGRSGQSDIVLLDIIARLHRVDEDDASVFIFYCFSSNGICNE